MFGIAYDRLKRATESKNPTVKLNKLVTTQTGTPDFETYIELFLSDTNETIHVEVEDDNRTYTFFTIQAAPVARANTENDIEKIYKGDKVVMDTPRFTVVKTKTFDDGGYLTLVKLGAPKVGRKINTKEFYEIDHVNVATIEVDKPQRYGETTITGSDSTGAQNPVILYYVNRVLTLEEAMFALGEIGEVN